MDKKGINCYIDMFSINQRIELPDGVITHAPLEVLPEKITQLCYSTNNFDLHFYGNLEYIDKIIYQVKEEETEKYSCLEHIKIEVN